MNKILFVSAFGLFLCGCAASDAVDDFAEEVIVKPQERAKDQVQQANAARLQIESQQEARTQALEDIMNQ